MEVWEQTLRDEWDKWPDKHPNDAQHEVLLYISQCCVILLLLFVVCCVNIGFIYDVTKEECSVLYRNKNLIY